MIDGLRPYGEYRHAGMPGLGQVPAHWTTPSLKHFYREVDERSGTGQEELLSVSHKTGVTPRSEKNVTMFMAASCVGHKKCAPDDLVVNTMWAWMGALGVARQVGLVSPSYAVYRPRSRELLPTYAEALFRTPAYVDEYNSRSTGITSSRLRLYPDEFLRIPAIYPPPIEQVAIVRFLDYADRRIRRYIRAKQKLIKLLEEQKQAITHDALRLAGTRNLRLGAAADSVERPINRQADQVYTPIGLYNRGRGIFQKPPTKGSELGDSTFFWIAEGDLVLSGQFAWEGAIALAGQEDDGCIASHRYPVLRGKPNIAESAYLLSFFQTGWGQVLLDHHSRGGAGRNRPLIESRKIE